MRMTIKEALERGLISEEQAKKQRSEASKSKAEQKKKVKAKRLSCSIDGDLPQEILWRACVRRWPDLVRTQKLVYEKGNVVEGRRYSLDMAFVDKKLAIEVDGWEFHGKHLEDFKRDREKDRLLLLNGWRVARFFAKEIFEDSDSLTKQIEQILDAI